jgi:EAL domain-containing protein (putative c-di-GMP-specific phosphodiesterase class I)
VGDVMNEIAAKQLASPIGLRMLVLAGDAQNAMLTSCAAELGISRLVKAENCSNALSILLRDPYRFDVVFCDLRTLGTDGLEFIYDAAQFEVGGFVLSAEVSSEMYSSIHTILSGYGSKLLGSMHDMLDSCHLHRLLMRCRKTTGVLPREDFQPANRWTRTELIDALNRDQFVPFFQPKFDLNSGRPTCVEILARWKHPDLGLVSPVDFVELMEQEELIDQLTGRLLFRSLIFARHCTSLGSKIGFAMNVSPVSLLDSRTPSRIACLIKECDVDPTHITIEVTETAACKNFGRILESLTRLRMQGLRISADDFGIGYSSMRLLSEMPFTELKIDRIFVADVSKNMKSLAILESLVRLADRLHLETVAEGIETQTDFEIVKALGCTYGQGFYLGRPMSGSDLLAFVKPNRPLHPVQFNQAEERVAA